jgi:hypothetical protein
VDSWSYGYSWEYSCWPGVRDTLDGPVSNCSLPCTDIGPFIMKYILERWRDSLDLRVHSKLHEVNYLVWRDYLFLWAGLQGVGGLDWM